MASRSRIDQFALFGEGNDPIPPEFLHVETISQRSRLFDWTISPHAHPGIFQILLLQRGSGIIAADGGEQAIGPGALLLLPAGCVHAFRFAPDAEGAVLSLALDLLHDPRIAALCRGVRAMAGAPRITMLDCASPAYARCQWLLDDLLSLLEQHRSGHLPDAVAARIALLVSVAEESAAGGEQTGNNKPHEHLGARFRRAVEQHFRNGRTVAEYARDLGASVPTLTRACRATTGKPPARIVHDRILLEAMRSLTYSSAPINQIADDLGFTEPAYFARFFRQRTGMTASQFRASRTWLRAEGDNPLD